MAGFLDSFVDSFGDPDKSAAISPTPVAAFQPVDRNQPPIPVPNTQPISGAKPPVQSAVESLFNGALPQVQADSATATARAKSADDVLTQAAQVQAQTQPQREANLGKLVTAKQAVLDNVTQETQNYAGSLTPLFQKQSALADRQAELANMNPFKRAFVELTSLSHNPDWLDEQAKGVQNQIQARTASYQNLMGIHDTVLKTLQQAYTDRDSLDQLHLANSQADVQMAMQGVGSANQVLSTELQGIGAQSKVLEAQAMARIDALGKMSHDQVNQAVAQAQANNGTATINGVPLTLGELKQSQMNWQDKELTMQSKQLAVQSGRLELANGLDAQYISKMQGPELKAAIANGGKLPNGQVLNQELLTRAYGALVTRNGIIAEQAANAGNIGVYNSQLSQIGQNVQGNMARAQNLFGSAPTELVQQANGIAAKLSGFAEASKKAAAAGAGQDFATQAVPQLAAVIDQQKKLNTDLALKWAGGDKDLASVGEAWLSGGPLNSNTAVTGLIKMARDGIPAGTKMSGAAQQTISRVKQIVDQFDAAQAGASQMSMFGKPKLAKGVIDPALLKKVNAALTGSYTAANVDSATQAIPAIARDIPGPDGKPHPASQIRPQDIAVAHQLGDSEAIKMVASKMGVTPETTQAIFNGGSGSPAWQSYVTGTGLNAQGQAVKTAEHKNADFGQLARQLQATQMTSMLAHLDATPSATPGFKPSAAFVSLLNDPTYQQRIQQGVEGQGQSSPGDFMVHAVAGNGFQQKFYAYSQLANQALAANQQNSVAQARTSAARLRNVSPVDSATIALNTIDGINPTEAQALIKAVQQTYWNQQGVGNSPMAQTEPPAGAIDSIISKTKFNDPHLEKIRQVAARDWAEAHRKSQNGILGLLDQSTAGAAHDPAGVLANLVN